LPDAVILSYDILVMIPFSMGIFEKLEEYEVPLKTFPFWMRYLDINCNFKYANLWIIPNLSFV